MKTLCSLLLLVFVSVAPIVSAADTDNTSVKSLPLMSRERFSFAKMEDNIASDWDKRTLTYRLYDRFGFGVIRNGYLRGSAGFKYQATDTLTVLALVSRSRFTRDDSKVVELAFKVSF